MADILFVTWDGGGNVPPALGVADELRGRGHHTRFLGHAVQVDRLAAHGHDVTAYPTARPFSSATPTSPSAMLALFGESAMGSDVLTELERRPADLVVVDCLLFGVMAALHRSGHPYAVLEHTFDGYLRRASRGPMGVMLRLRGLRPLTLIDAGEPALVTSLSELDRGHGDVLHTGPVVTGVPARPESPTVLISLSTFAFRSLRATWQRVLDAVDGLPARVVATTGPALDDTGLRVPSGVELHQWLSHDGVLPRTSLVVGHGGQGTTMAALAHGVPLLVLPLDSKSDQPTVGRAVERAGAGRVLPRRAAPRRIRAAVEELLEDGPHRAAAERLGEQIRATDGAGEAARALEDALRRRSSPTSASGRGRRAP
jgi:UDP:flavonoid glycosyltransferase YjiC (YdhE family)